MLLCWQSDLICAQLELAEVHRLCAAKRLPNVCACDQCAGLAVDICQTMCCRCCGTTWEQALLKRAGEDGLQKG